ncbi:hypothetical protein ABLO26_24645 [Neobacillus sp. 179-J 1A1 HS]
MEVISVHQRDNGSNYQSLRSLLKKNVKVNSISEYLDSCNVSNPTTD